MDDELFRKKLSEVSQWEIPLLGQNGGPAKPNQRRKITQTIIDEFGEEQTITVIDTDENETIAPKIKKILPITKPCEHCGQTVTDRKVTYKLYFGNGDRGVWKIKCTHCKMHKNPWTGEFNVEPDMVGRVCQELQRDTPSKINRCDSIFIALKSKVTK